MRKKTRRIRPAGRGSLATVAESDFSTVGVADSAESANVANAAPLLCQLLHLPFQPLATDQSLRSAVQGVSHFTFLEILFRGWPLIALSSLIGETRVNTMDGPPMAWRRTVRPSLPLPCRLFITTAACDAMHNPRSIRYGVRGGFNLSKSLMKASAGPSVATAWFRDHARPDALARQPHAATIQSRYLDRDRFEFRRLAEGANEWANATAVNNHFDTDGVLSVWTLLDPERTLANRELLIAAAEAGDFDEWPPLDRGLWLDAAIRALGVASER